MGSETHYSLDRFEDNGLAVLEKRGQTILLPRAWLPRQAREGDIISVVTDQTGCDSEPGRRVLSLEVDTEATELSRARSGERRRRLPRGPSGDIDL